MNTKNLIRTSKKLSWLLRHGANECNLQMDVAGWVEREAVLGALRITDNALDWVIRENNKSRLQVDGTRIRACQGHSLDGTPVTADALEASWQQWKGVTSLWHGTSVDAVEGIAKHGILPQARTHVHLAEATDSRVGKRAGVSLLLEVSPQLLEDQGLGVYRSPNGVLLVRTVPARCIVDVQVFSKRARLHEAELRTQLWGL